MKKLKRALLITLSVILTIVLAFFIYAEIYYHAKDVDSYMESSDTVEVSETSSYFSFKGEGDDYSVLILYPGAKVEAKAYAPLARSIAEEGNHVYIMRMPFRLAFFKINAGSEIFNLESNGDYTPRFYFAGHSLGGAMGASFCQKNQDKLSGMIYLASYSTYDFSSSSLKSMAIYGSEDKVLKMDNYKKYLSNQPKNFTENVIEGGCHAYFASYGAQSGDGTPTITMEEQTEITKNLIVDFMKE